MTNERPQSDCFRLFCKRAFARSLDGPSKPGVNPLLRIGSSENDKLLQNMGQPWEKPNNISTSTVKMEWFNYATAWQINDSVLYLSIVVLVCHLVISLAHAIYVVFWTKQTSESWDSITELIALAYHSSPGEDTLKNCGAGIMLLNTLRKRVKVVAVGDGDGDETSQRVRLITCDTPPLPNQESRCVEVGKEYG